MKRNGKIDLLRFIFAIVIMLHHLGMRTDLFDALGLHFQVVSQRGGGFAVVFFFLVSGALLAKSTDKIVDSADIPKVTTQYLWKKYKYFMTWYIPAFILNFVWDCMRESISGGIKHSLYNISGFFMMQYIGLNGGELYPNGFYVPASWYLSALMICSLVLFPLILWKREIFIRIIAPLTSIASLYVLLNYKNRFRIASGLWYPLAVMCAGCIAYELAKNIKNTEEIYRHGITLRIAEAAIYLLTIVYISSDLQIEFEYPMFMLLTIAVAISFSGGTDDSLLSHKIFSFLGRASFPLYLFHEAISLIYIELLNKHGINHGYLSHIILYILCIVIAFLAQYVYDTIKKNKTQIKKVDA